MNSAPFRNPLVVALDVDSSEQALKLVDELGDIVGGFKIGPRLCLREGMGLAQKISAQAPVFLDNKHFDIPSTMEAAIKASFDCGASAVTVHALAGLEALKKMADLEKELNTKRDFRILAVTILTSWKSLPPSMKALDIAEHVKIMITQIQESGLRSLVCSAEELALAKGSGLFCLTPGIRFPEDSKDDQSRVSDPRSALAQGSSALVVGRPIIQAQNPRIAALKFLESLGVK